MFTDAVLLLLIKYSLCLLDTGECLCCCYIKINFCRVLMRIYETGLILTRCFQYFRITLNNISLTQFCYYIITTYQIHLGNLANMYPY